MNSGKSCLAEVSQLLIYQVALINQYWVRLHGDFRGNESTMILASTTKMKKNRFVSIVGFVELLLLSIAARETMLVWSQICAGWAWYRNQSCSNEFLMESNGRYDHYPEDHLFDDKDLHLDHFQSFECGFFISYESIMDTLEASLLLHFFLSWWAMQYYLSLASSRNGAREVALYLVVRNRKEVHWYWMYFFFLLCSFSQEVHCTCSRRYQCPFMINILHCVLGSVSSESHSSMFPTSWIICFDSWLKGLNDSLCCRSSWRACWFGWFSIFWINSRTLARYSCLTVECGSPGILKFMSSSILSRINSLSLLSVLISW